MLGGFGDGVPIVLVTVVAPAPVTAVTAAGYGAPVRGDDRDALARQRRRERVASCP